MSPDVSAADFEQEDPSESEEELPRKRAPQTKKPRVKRFKHSAKAKNEALVHWPPSKIFGDEITVRTFCYLVLR